MSPGLLFPAGLAALAALALPLLLHLTRRQESRLLPFAAMRWLEAKARPRRRLRLEELLLLALRLLLLAVVALWLAQPVLWRPQDRRPVLALAPGLALPTDLVGPRGVWLAPGFPPLSTPAPAPLAALPSLIRQLDAELPAGAPLEVVVPETLADADAERLLLSRTVAWRVAPAAAPPNASPPAAPLGLAVRHGEGEAARLRWFRAAAIAWAAPGAAPAFEAGPVTSALPASSAVLVWLAPGPAPEAVAAWVRRGGVALLAHDASLAVAGAPVPVWHDAAGAPLATAQRLGAGRLLRLLRPLEPAAMPVLVEPEFPDLLLRLLQPPPAPQRVRAVDYAPGLSSARAAPQPRLDLRPWFALAAGLLFLLERLFATRRREAAPP